MAIHQYTSYKTYVENTGTQCNTNNPRGLYVWTYTIITAPNTEQNDLLQFCIDYCIDTIYLESEAAMLDANQRGLAIFIDKAYNYGTGVKVELLIGWANFALEPQHNYLLTVVGNAKTFITRFYTVGGWDDQSICGPL